jgi:hypothetical protein
MTTIVTADRGRLSIRGVQDGRSYLVQTLPEGWFVRPQPPEAPPKRSLEWSGPQRDLTEHLDDLAKHGLVVERTMDQEAPPCRF